MLHSLNTTHVMEKLFNIPDIMEKIKKAMIDLLIHTNKSTDQLNSPIYSDQESQKT